MEKSNFTREKKEKLRRYFNGLSSPWARMKKGELDRLALELSLSRYQVELFIRKLRNEHRSNLAKTNTGTNDESNHQSSSVNIQFDANLWAELTRIASHVMQQTETIQTMFEEQARNTQELIQNLATQITQGLTNALE